jgi:ribosomal protein S21
MTLRASCAKAALGKKMSIEVVVQDGNIERAILRLRTKVARSGLSREMSRAEFFESKREKRKRKDRKSLKRIKRQEQRIRKRNGLD